MEPIYIVLPIVLYFGLLFAISLWTGRKADEEAFFRGNRSSPWFVVAFGMIGASLSGVTFISVPGWVGTQQFAYMQMVLGYMVGYVVIAYVLMPMYYRLNLTSIYKYLDQRFGPAAYKTGASFFLLSRILGASFRLFLVAMVLDEFVLTEDFIGVDVPFHVAVEISIALIYVYTFRGGIKTVVWTDTLQTLFMLVGAGMGVYFIVDAMQFEGIGDAVEAVRGSGYAKTWFWDVNSPLYFWKQFLGGAFIAIVMTGLDQDMMQKNLTCKTLKDAQKNMLSFSTILIFVNLGFLALGALLFMYGQSEGLVEMDAGKMSLLNSAGEMEASGTDKLFPYLALNSLPVVVGVTFILGLIAAAYSSADSALTALTTSFCIDFLGFEEKKDRDWKQRVRRQVHIGMALVLFVAIMIFHLVNDTAVIAAIFSAATYTYGPLLGMYAFGLFTKLKVRDHLVPLVAVLSPVALYLLNYYTDGWLGFATLIVNGMLTFLGMLLISKRTRKPDLAAKVG